MKRLAIPRTLLLGAASVALLAVTGCGAFVDDTPPAASLVATPVASGGTDVVLRAQDPESGIQTLEISATLEGGHERSLWTEGYTPNEEDVYERSQETSARAPADAIEITGIVTNGSGKVVEVVESLRAEAGDVAVMSVTATSADQGRLDLDEPWLVEVEANSSAGLDEATLKVIGSGGISVTVTPSLAMTGESDSVVFTVPAQVKGMFASGDAVSFEVTVGDAAGGSTMRASGDCVVTANEAPTVENVWATPLNVESDGIDPAGEVTVHYIADDDTAVARAELLMSVNSSAYSTVRTANTASGSFSVPGSELSAGGTVSFQVRAVGEDGASATSETVGPFTVQGAQSQWDDPVITYSTPSISSATATILVYINVGTDEPVQVDVRVQGNAIDGSAVSSLSGGVYEISFVASAEVTDPMAQTELAIQATVTNVATGATKQTDVVTVAVNAP